jgi:protein phosphatase
MLICPECKFENPNSNKFCQNCGTSLTEKVCPACGVDVPVNAEQCHNCQEFCGTVWWAIVTRKEMKVDSSVQPEVDEDITFIQLPVIDAGETVSVTTAITPTVSEDWEFHVGDYLDSQQRYKIVEPLPSQASSEVCLRVLDCQPYQFTPIMAVLDSHNRPDVELFDVPVIPIAKPYLELYTQYHQGVPPIHDAWQEGNKQVILLEDRSNWEYLLELWRDDKTTSLQMVHYFYQMTQLWSMLEPLHCQASLLELSNLRLDEDHSLVLQRLYVETQCNEALVDSCAEVEPTMKIDEDSLTIKTLGCMWHTLFRQSQRTQFGAVMQLLGDLDTNSIQTMEQLQSRLKAIASELEPTPDLDDSSDVTVTLVSAPNTAAPTVLQFEQPEENGNKSDDAPTIVLPMQLNSLENAGLTDVGRQRDHNEDYFGIETKVNKTELPKASAIAARGLYILCDGMGGHAGGEVASELAVSTLRKYFQTYWNYNHLPSGDIIRQGVKEANQAIYDLNQKDARSGVGRMGTTLVMVLVQDTHIAVAHVGDSRLYRYTRKGLEQITIDHEVGQREIARGVEPSIAYARPDAYQLTQALGPRDENLIDPDVQFFQVSEDTLFILASDGLSDNNLLETHWQTHLRPLLSTNADLDKGVRELIDIANKYNGHDNITAVLIRAKVRPSVGVGSRE